MSFNFGSSDSEQRGTQQLVVPEASPEERELRKLNLELAKRQLASLDKAEASQATYDASPLAASQRRLQEVATQNLLDRITGVAPVLSPAQQQQLDTIYGATEAQGQESLRRFADELAGMRGLNMSDTPVAAESLRNARMFQQQLAGQKAASALDLGNTGANFNAALAQFQNNLQQQAFANRLAIAGLTPASYGLQNSLFGERAAQGTNTMSGSGNVTGWNAGFDLARLLGAAGQSGFRLGG